MALEIPDASAIRLIGILYSSSRSRRAKTLGGISRSRGSINWRPQARHWKLAFPVFDSGARLTICWEPHRGQSNHGGGVLFFIAVILSGGNIHEGQISRFLSNRNHNSRPKSGMRETVFFGTPRRTRKYWMNMELWTALLRKRRRKRLCILLIFLCGKPSSGLSCFAP